MPAAALHGRQILLGDRMDTRTPEQRRRIMRSVKSRDTGPELLVRRRLHALGFRFRLHRKDLPGKPDIVLPSRKLAIFVHGCFWHWHGCSKGRLPKSRKDFWQPKLARNRERDRTNEERLGAVGWRVLTIWQCETVDQEALDHRLQKAVSEAENSIDIGTPHR